MQYQFIELLQVTLGARERLSRAPSYEEWVVIYEEAKRQSIAGIMVSGLERLPENQRPPRVIMLQWIGICQKIEVQNSLTTKACHIICKRLEQDGFLACVLKGQSNYRYYPIDMKNRRSCGDIDIWVVPHDDSCNHPVRKVLEYVKTSFDMNGLCWLHTNYMDKSGVPVEIHFRPSFMNEPCMNRRFQVFFGDIEECRMYTDLDGLEIPVMKVDENVVYQMNHIYRHLMDEGVGLRQVVDYYFLLTAWNKSHTRSKEGIMQIVSSLGMMKFARALMYVLYDVCGMKEELLLCPASVSDGEFLKNEILLAGNFGHHDSRMADISEYKGYYDSRVQQAWRRLKRNLRFLTSYPGEVIWEPIVRVGHFVWKKLSLWKY